MKTFHVATLTAALTIAAPVAAAQVLSTGPLGQVGGVGKYLVQTFVCQHADRSPCAAGDLTNPRYKQIVVLSTGFAEADRGSFWQKFDTFVAQTTAPNAAGVWSVQRKDQLLFVGFFTGGGALGTSTASFGAKVLAHPIRGLSLSYRQGDVYSLIDGLPARQYPALSPFAAAVLFNTNQSNITLSTASPSFTGRKYGVAAFPLQSLEGAYAIAHELAHAGLSFADEYTEQGLQEQNIHSLDALNPLLQLDASWGASAASIGNLLGLYSVQLSEILANNGNDNVTTTRYPSTVSTPGFSGEDYKYESGMFFGRGTWHMAGANLMNSNFVTRGLDDGFAYAHSPAQQRVIGLAFGDNGKYRPNDRLSNAGPLGSWTVAYGATTRVMLRDADMYHQFQPTKSYNVQASWYEQQWSTCWSGPVPFPCSQSVWTTAQKNVARPVRSMDLKLSAAYGQASLLQGVLCELGVSEIIAAGGGTFRLCESDLGTIPDALSPTVKFRVPYLDVDVPATNWMTTYYWRFSTNNGFVQSGYTGWSSFYRSM